MEINSEKLQLFENQEIRTAWDAEREEWYSSNYPIYSIQESRAI